MRVLTLATALVFAAPTLTLAPARAEEPAPDAPTGVAGTVAQVRATENDGFGDLKWGSDLKAVYAAYPELKKFYPQAKVAGILKSGKTAVLETKLRFKGVPYDGKLVLDAQGLFRATIELKVVEDPEAPVTMEKAIDPILGDLSNPDEDTPDSRLWKGSGSVISVSKTRGVGSFRIDISFYAKGSYRPENTGGSLGID